MRLDSQSLVELKVDSRKGAYEVLVKKGSAEARLSGEKTVRLVQGERVSYTGIGGRLIEGKESEPSPLQDVTAKLR